MVDIEKLNRFTGEARPLFAALRPIDDPLPDPNKLALTCSALRQRLLGARNAGAFANPWSIAGLGRREVRNCAVLAKLWDPLVTGEAGRRFLLTTLQRAASTGGPSLPIRDLTTSPYSVLCETCLGGDGVNRLDIVIESLGGEGGWSIVFEVKIDAGLGEKQLERYGKDLKSRREWACRETYFFFLSPSAPDDIIDNIAHLRWRDVTLAAHEIAGANQNLTQPEILIAAFGDHVADFDN